MISRLIFRYYVQSMKFVLLLAGFLSISIANDCAEGQVLVETKCYNQNDLEILVEFADSSNLFINNPDLFHKVFKDNNFEIRIVGGAVRDIALNKAPKDIDFASDATPDEMIAMFDKEAALILIGPIYEEYLKSF